MSSSSRLSLSARLIQPIICPSQMYVHSGSLEHLRCNMARPYILTRGPPPLPILLPISLSDSSVLPGAQALNVVSFHCSPSHPLPTPFNRFTFRSDSILSPGPRHRRYHLDHCPASSATTRECGKRKNLETEPWVGGRENGFCI